MKTQKFLTGLLIVAMLILTLIPTSSANATSAQAKLQGGVDLLGYCKKEMGGKSVELVVPQDAYSWRCVNWWWPKKKTFDMNKVCAWEYGHLAYAGTSKPSDPFSWKCYK